MSTTPPYTVTKLVRWRVKDWVSCFNACKFPIEEESDHTNSPPPRRLPRRETQIGKSKVGTSNQKPKKEVESSSSSASASASASAPARKRVVAKKKEIVGEASSRWPSFADDDYIIFCFRDDGEVHVLPEKKSNVNVGSTSTSTSNVKRLNLQLLRLEDEAERNENNSNGKVKGKEAAIYASNEIKEIREIVEEEETGEGREISGASSDSNDQSDTASTSSFAFPIIQGEWIGSPVQMPRPRQVQKPKNNRIHCCRF